METGGGRTRAFCGAPTLFGVPTRLLGGKGEGCTMVGEEFDDMFCEAGLGSNRVNSLLSPAIGIALAAF